MSYRRRTYIDNRADRRTKVQLYWNNLSNAYSLKFSDTHKWTQMQGVLTWIKQTIVWTEREYDDSIRTWFIHEKHIPKLKELLELLDADFDLDFIEKPQAQSSFGKFIPTEVYLKTFNSITQSDISQMSAEEAKKVYRKTCMLLHPDKNPGHPEVSARMSELNEAWAEIQIKHFKTKELVQQL
jgi:hypothetical protein